jgi:hypothetical protein
MPTEGKPNLQLEIAHVLFIDIVGYSKLLIDDQRELQQQLNQIVRNTHANGTKALPPIHLGMRPPRNAPSLPPARLWKISSPRSTGLRYGLERARANRRKSRAQG